MADSGRFKPSKSKPIRKTYLITDPDIKDIKVLGKGAYGCVVKPVKKCKDDSINQAVKREEETGKKFVTKIIKDRSDRSENRHIVEKTIDNNEIARRASSRAIRSNDRATEDYGMEIYDCELETPVQIPDCQMPLSDQSLIMTELGGMDGQEIIGPKKRELITDLTSITVDDIERAILSNLINIQQLHLLGWVNLDIKLGNLLPNFSTPFSFKIIDYDLFQKLNKRDAFGYYEAKYFFPPEYTAYGKVLWERRPSLTETDFLNWVAISMNDLFDTLSTNGYDFVVDKFYDLVYNIKPPVQADSDAAWSNTYKLNKDTLVRLHRAVLARTDKSKYNVPEFKELVASVEYYMYAIAIYTFIAELLPTRPLSEKTSWESILDRLALFFHPIYEKRLEAINNFIRTQTF
jgi:serine/threonine protein kinase